MNEYSNSECTAPIPAWRPCPKNQPCSGCTDLTQAESLAAYPTTVRLEFLGVAEPKLRSTVGRPRTLTDQQIRAILEEYANYVVWRALRRSVMSQRDLARAMGVSPATISYAVRLQGKYKQPSPEGRQANTNHRRRAIGRLIRRHLL
jgi:ribosome-binding protein aMBF1 (putative translation factor)